MLGLLNVKKDLRDSLSQVLSICNLDETVELPELQALFIDWLPNTNELFGKQALVVENYIKSGIPTVIFDRYLSLSNEELAWLRKFNVSFFEPVIHFRRGFEFFPQWTEGLDKFWDENINKEPTIHLGYSGKITDRTATFDKYFVNYAGMFPESTVRYCSTDTKDKQIKLKKNKQKEWENYNLIWENSLDYSNIAFTVLIGSRIDYLTGRLRNDFFEIMKQGCVPLLPIEHRFYGSMFQELTVKDEKFIDYFIANCIELRPVMIEGIFKNIFDHYPEFTMQYAVDKIKYYLVD